MYVFIDFFSSICINHIHHFTVVADAYEYMYCIYKWCCDLSYWHHYQHIFVISSLCFQPQGTSFWWFWVGVFNDIFFIQYFVICTCVFMYIYGNIYYTTGYVFLNFFLLGVYLAVFQLELFTAFLWLVECSVIFVFLLFLFYFNVKGVFNYIFVRFYLLLPLVVYVFVCVFNLLDSASTTTPLLPLYTVVENYYEAFINNSNNDLLVFAISYYVLNFVEFLIIGFILLVGSVVCVNLYQMCKNIRTQSYFNFLINFNFLFDFSSFYFLRRQSLIKQGFTKAALKFFKKK